MLYMLGRERGGRPRSSLERFGKRPSTVARKAKPQLVCSTLAPATPGAPKVGYQHCRFCCLMYSCCTTPRTLVLKIMQQRSLNDSQYHMTARLRHLGDLIGSSTGSCHGCRVPRSAIVSRHVSKCDYSMCMCIYIYTRIQLVTYVHGCIHVHMHVHLNMYAYICSNL